MSPTTGASETVERGRPTVMIKSRMGSQFAIVCSLSLGTVALTACTAGGEGDALSPQELWAQDLANAKSDATSEFEEAVFEDGLIDQNEYAEAWQRYIACMRESGHPGSRLVGPDADGFYSESIESPKDNAQRNDDEISDTSFACARGTNLQIAQLYEGQKRNPQHLRVEDAITKCLIDAGVVEPDYTAEDFVRDARLKTGDGFNASDPQASACLSNPYAHVEE